MSPEKKLRRVWFEICFFLGGDVLGHGFWYVSGFCNKLCFKHVYSVLEKQPVYGGTRNSIHAQERAFPLLEGAEFELLL